jgi:hypothetical protein
VGAGLQQGWLTWKGNLFMSSDEKDSVPYRLPYVTAGGDLVIPFDSDPKYHWWKGGQSVEKTRAEALARQADHPAKANG